MKAITAKDAKNRFGELMDTVQREPVSIEKHGRPVAVVLSEVEYEKMKLECLRAMLAVGEAQLDRGEGIETPPIVKRTGGAVAGMTRCTSPDRP